MILAYYFTEVISCSNTFKRCKLLVVLLLFGLQQAFCQEICNNGIDDDGDGLIDCYDNDCSDSTNCESFFISNYKGDTSCLTTPDIDSTFELVSLWTSETMSSGLGVPMVADMDGDGYPELIAASDSNGAGLFPPTYGQILILDGNTGVTKTKITLLKGQTVAPGFYSYNIAVADINSDGLGEIIIRVDTSGMGVNNFSRLFCFDIMGNLLWKADSGIDNRSFGVDYGDYPTITDFNADSIPEVFIGRNIFNATNGELISRVGPTLYDKFVAFGFSMHSSIAADFIPTDSCVTCDGLELVVGNSIYSLDISNDAFYLWSQLDDSMQIGFNSMADMDGDSLLDIVTVATLDNSLGTYDSTIVYSWNPRNGSVMKQNMLIFENGFGGRANLGDFDNDGAVEVGFAGSEYYMALDNDLSIMWQHKVKDVSSSVTGSSLFDFNCDGSMEVVYRDEEFLRIMEGENGNTLDSIACISGTYREFPVIVDVNNDKHAEIICMCDSITALGPKIFAFGNKKNNWYPTRKVMNQYNYFATNINDDLSIPIVPQNQSLIPALNGFLNQPSNLDADGNPACFIEVNDLSLFIDSVEYIEDECNEVKVTYVVCSKNDLAIIPSGSVASIYNGDGVLLLKDTIFYEFQSDTCVQRDIILSLGKNSSMRELFFFINDIKDGFETAPNIDFLECSYDNNADSTNIVLTTFDFAIKDTTICPYDTAMFSASAADSYLWEASSGKLIGATDSNNIKVILDSEDSVDVLLTVILDNCSFTNRNMVKPFYTEIFIINDSCVFGNQCLQLSEQTGFGSLNYSWTPNLYLNNESQLNTISCPVEDVIYQLKLTDDNGCVFMDSVLICVKQLIEPILPTIFTPNGDGLNDQLGFVEPISGELINLSIYNRWGELVFITKDKGFQWDGTYLEEEQETGVYQVALFYTNIEGAEFEYHQPITLVR